jgi:glycosyltransferase involved in cell wall biosynthesis/ribosomal protein S18 acetylase RimI-like enzyme
MKIAHLTTVDLSLRYLILPQLEAALEWGESIGISAPGEYVVELEERDIRHIALSSSTRGMNLGSDLKAMRQLWKVLKLEKPDILHTHNPKPGVYGRVLGRLAGVPIVVNTVHGLYATPDDSFAKRGIVYALEAVASRFSDAELVQNPEDLDLLRRLRIVAPAKLRLLGNGVDLERFNPERAAASREVTRAALGIQSDEVAVGMVGRLVAEKGIPELVDAMPRLHPRTRVFVVGPHDPDKSDALESDVLQRGTASGVEFLGMRPDVDLLYGAFDLFVLPSHREGFPRAAMEAAGSGLPLVLTDIRGCRQVVDHGVNGFLVPVRDPNSLAEAINSLVDDEALRRRMGNASLKKASLEFDEDRVVETVMETYRLLAEEKGISWLIDRPGESSVFRSATPVDATSIARLHLDMIDTGFLSSLGVGFLRLLYRSLIESNHGTVTVAETDGVIVAFIAGTDDTGAFYKQFLRSHFLEAMWRLLPAVVRPRTWKRMWETVRYGGGKGSVAAELLSMAVAPKAQGSGLGSRLVDTLLDQMKARGVDQVKVVAGDGNQAAISLYSRCGFEFSRGLEVHRGVRSLEMIWNS